MHIPLLPTLLVLLLHSPNPTLAIPGEPKYPAGVDPKTNPYERTQDGVPGKPTWECTYKKKVLWNRYVLEARNWNMSEEVLKEACSKSDMMTVWNFDPEWHDVDGAQRIAVAFSLPIKTAKRLENNLNNLMDPMRKKFLDLKKMKCTSKPQKVPKAGGHTRLV